MQLASSRKIIRIIILLFIALAPSLQPAAAAAQNQEDTPAPLAPVGTNTPNPEGIILHTVQYGETLYTIALVGTALTGLSLNREFLILPIGDWQVNALVMATAMLATPITFYFNINRKHGPVLASAIVGLAGGLILPAVLPQFGATLAVVSICASFAGMTSKERCPDFWHIFITGFFTGVTFVYSTPLLGGAGGKLGTIAFGAVLGTCGLKRLMAWIRNPRRLKDEDQGA